MTIRKAAALKRLRREEGREGGREGGESQPSRCDW